MTSSTRAPRPTPRPHGTDQVSTEVTNGRPQLRLIWGGDGNTGGPTPPSAERKRKRGVVAVGAVVVAGILGVGAFRVASGGESEPLMRNSSPKIEALNKKENAIAEAIMATNGKIETPVKVDGGVLTQRSDITRVTLDEPNATLKLRNQPAVVRDLVLEGKETSNTALEIGNNGLGQPNNKAGESNTADFYSAYVLTQDDGDVWIGGVVDRDGKDKAYDTPEELAADMVWFAEGATKGDVFSGVTVTAEAGKASQHPRFTVGDNFSTQASVRYYDALQQ